jgi:hypothetical protein
LEGKSCLHQLNKLDQQALHHHLAIAAKHMGILTITQPLPPSRG